MKKLIIILLIIWIIFNVFALLDLMNCLTPHIDTSLYDELMIYPQGYGAGVLFAWDDDELCLCLGTEYMDSLDRITTPMVLRKQYCMLVFIIIFFLEYCLRSFLT